MRYAADLHLHSRYAEAVSPAMTLETLARYARRKGVDVMATGDCLQPDWQRELEEKLTPSGSEPGWFRLRPEVDEPICASLPENLKADLRFVLGTEVHCAPSGTRELEGIHFLIYFPSFTAVHRFRERVKGFGDLSDGRPRLAIPPRELLQLTLECGDDLHFAPAHVMNPYFSTLGSVMKHCTLEEVFGDLAPELLAVEMGLTSIPPMCRRISSLDRHALFACSDAHSPENIGRECTILETEPGYAPMFEAIRRGSRDEVIGCVKYSIHRTRYFLNWCAKCKRSYEEAACPKGHGRLATGSRDWLDHIADRTEPAPLPNTPRFRMYVPLMQLITEFLRLGKGSKQAGRLCEQLLRGIKHERHILTQAPFDEIAGVSSEALAGAIIGQRSVGHHAAIRIEPAGAQPELDFFHGGIAYDCFRQPEELPMEADSPRKTLD